MPQVWTSYYQPEYPVRRATFYWLSFSSTIERFQLDQGAIERDGTILLSSTLLNRLRHRGNTYGVNASSGSAASSDVRDAALAGSGGAGITVIHGENTDMPGWIAEQTAFGNTNWGNANGLNAVPAWITTDGMNLSAPGAPPSEEWLDVEFHPDDVPDPDNITADSGEVLDAWLTIAWQSQNTEVDRDPQGAQYHARIPTIGETSDATTWDTDVFTESAGPVLDGAFDLPYLGDDVWGTHKLEFPDLSTRLSSVRDIGATGGAFPIVLGANPITGVPGNWADPLGGVATLKLEAPLTFLVQDVSWRPPRVRYLVELDRKPYQRVYPRADEYGASTAKRVWPPVRSQQATNRVVGGTFL